ncbi:tRNA dihydrouridine synthase DusB, partial [Patescibacteria group bacterium]|nr:tRNA dihydrouridine synthase DusB [Patescibacteria group bacterium]
MFSWEKIKKPIVALAPMADYTDSPFCLMCRSFGADIVYREMVSADAIAHGSEKTLEMARFDKRERPIILQIFGKDPKVMAEAARILEKKYKPDGIDINMGCPARKIVSAFNGASLIREPKLAAQIIRAVKGAVKAPVSVKTRLGWEKPDEILRFAPIIERAGADALAIHARTKKQGFSGKANWEMIGRARRLLKIPVLVNGDITDTESFKKALEVSGADGALIGRGALGKPWIFQNTKSRTVGHRESDSKKLNKIILEHAELHFARHGELKTFRKHLVYYVKGLPRAKRLREKLVQVETIEGLKNTLKSL